MSFRKTDFAVNQAIKNEKVRQQQKLAMIPSENYISKEVREAVGSVLSNKYSEGYANRRYYQGNEHVDEIELLAIERAKKLFKVPHANVQPYSGSPANAAVFLALLKPQDKIMGMSLPFGGHLTHGHPTVTLSGSYFETLQYETDENGYIDYEKLEKLAKKFKPKIIVSGATAYPRKINFKKFGEIADKVGAYHLADISHIAGLVVSGQHPSPTRHAHIIMTTTHKTLRGPRGAMLMVTKKGLEKDPKLSTKIDRAVFPGLQGGPHNNTTAGIAIALNEAMSSSFIRYSKQIIKNSKALAKSLKKLEFKLVSGGTDTHLLLVDVTNKGLDGWSYAWALDHAGIIVNRNTIPFDKRSAYYPSGIRIGTPAVTTRGMKEKEMERIAEWISEVAEISLQYVSDDFDSKDKRVRGNARRKFRKDIQKDKKIKKISSEVKKMCMKYPTP